jgi:hypothetical protein
MARLSGQQEINEADRNAANEYITQYVDKNGDGKLNIAEFVEYMMNNVL